MRTATRANGAGRETRGRLADPDLNYEEIVLHRGRRSGAYVIVAVHSTLLGPALGGARMWHYASPAAALDDAMRLAAAMTMKAAAAGLDLGGGKGVICAPEEEAPSGGLRRDLLLDFADLVDSLGGRYITAEDVGTGARDMVTFSERTDHVVGLPSGEGGSGDPSPITAIGVEAAMRACAARRLGSADLSGIRVAVIGLGHVGSRLARSLAAHGAELIVSDIDGGKRELARALDATWVDADEALLAECEILAPCALGGAVDAANVDALRCAVVCGSANNVLADDRLAARLDEREITYAPDFIANAGGLINVYGELRGYAPERGRALARGIEGTMGRILDAAAERSITPLQAARELARERLTSARGVPAHRDGHRTGRRRGAAAEQREASHSGVRHS